MTSNKIHLTNYYDGEISVENMQWGLVVPLKNGTRILIRDRFEPDVWISGVYEMQRWPSREGTFHAGAHVKESGNIDITWRAILHDDEVKLV